MNPYIALQIVEDHQARLRGEAALCAPFEWSLRDMSRAALKTSQRARRAAGWALVEIGFKLAVSVSGDPVGRAKNPAQHHQLETGWTGGRGR
jgi:hypothetical protein